MGTQDLRAWVEANSCQAKGGGGERQAEAGKPEPRAPSQASLLVILVSTQPLATLITQDALGSS